MDVIVYGMNEPVLERGNYYLTEFEQLLEILQAL
jgi:hypothetical protein